MKKYLLIAVLCLTLTGCAFSGDDAAFGLLNRASGLGHVPPEQLTGWLEGGG